jgi:hypothetical protein
MYPHIGGILMPLSREVDCFPDGDFAFLVVVPKPDDKASLWFYTWDQVEADLDDGRKSNNPPKYQASLANREMLQLAKYLLKLAGHEAANQIDIPDQAWHQVRGPGVPK